MQENVLIEDAFHVENFVTLKEIDRFALAWIESIGVVPLIIEEKGGKDQIETDAEKYWHFPLLSAVMHHRIFADTNVTFPATRNPTFVLKKEDRFIWNNNLQQGVNFRVARCLIDELENLVNVATFFQSSSVRSIIFEDLKQSLALYPLAQLKQLGGQHDDQASTTNVPLSFIDILLPFAMEWLDHKVTLISESFNSSPEKLSQLTCSSESIKRCERKISEQDIKVASSSNQHDSLTEQYDDMTDLILTIPTSFTCNQSAGSTRTCENVMYTLRNQFPRLKRLILLATDRSKQQAEDAAEFINAEFIKRKNRSLTVETTVVNLNSQNLRGDLAKIINDAKNSETNGKLGIYVLEFPKTVIGLLTELAMGQHLPLFCHVRLTWLNPTTTGGQHKFTPKDVALRIDVASLRAHWLK